MTQEKSKFCGEKVHTLVMKGLFLDSGGRSFSQMEEEVTEPEVTAEVEVSDADDNFGLGKTPRGKKDLNSKVKSLNEKSKSLFAVVKLECGANWSAAIVTCFCISSSMVVTKEGSIACDGIVFDSNPQCTTRDSPTRRDRIFKNRLL